MLSAPSPCCPSTYVQSTRSNQGDLMTPSVSHSVPRLLHESPVTPIRSFPDLGPPLKLSFPTRNRKRLLFSPLSSHQKKGPGGHAGVGTTAGQAGSHLRLTARPRGYRDGAKEKGGRPGRARALCLCSEQSKPGGAGGRGLRVQHPPRCPHQSGKCSRSS